MKISKSIDSIINDLITKIKYEGNPEQLELATLLKEYLSSKLQKVNSDKFYERIEYARKLVEEIESNLNLADELGELEWFSTKLDFQNQLIINCKELLRVANQLKLKGEQDV